MLESEELFVDVVQREIRSEDPIENRVRVWIGLERRREYEPDVETGNREDPVRMARLRDLGFGRS